MRLDPALKLLYRSQSATEANRQAISRAQSREILDLFQPVGTGRHSAASLLVMIQFMGDEEQLALNGFEARSRLGSVYTGLLDPDRLSDLLTVPGVVFVQLSRALHPFREPGTARPVLAAPGETATENLSLTAGAGVLIGFIDTGVDVSHQDFRKPDGKTRIKFLLDFSDPGDIDGDGRLDGPDDFGGTLYTETQINAALRSSSGSLRQKDTTGHGTLGLSVAAGDDPVLPGVAPAADLIVVKATRREGTLDFESADVLDALSFIDRKAAELGRPYVVNLSLGTAFGPHDGRTLEEKAIDSLVGPGIPGKVVVLAAGNSGGDGNRFRHLQGTAYAGLETRHVLTIPAYGTPTPGVNNDTALLDLWYEGNDRLTVRVTAPDGRTTVEAPYGDFADEPTPFGQVFIGNMGGASPLNGDVEAIVLLYDKSGIAPAAGEWTISLTGERIEANGVYHGWLVDGASVVGGVEPYLSSGADNRFLVGRPGSAANGITVGSFARHDPAGRYRTSWTDVRGILRTDTTAHAEDLSTFSSPGATRDGRIKPEIVAPGERVLGAVSRDAHPAQVPSSLFRDHPFPEPDALLVDATADHGFGLLQGTSFAAPTVTGLAARILSADPDLDAVQVRNILINAARVDAFTGAVPNDLWGYGKADLSLAADPSRPLPSSLRIASEPLAVGIPGRQYNHVFTALGGSLPYTWSVIQGTLPPGLRLATGALLTGVPTMAGVWRFTLQAEDSSPLRQMAQRVCEVRVEPKPALGIVTKRLPLARTVQAYAVALQGEGGTPPYTWSVVAGSLPPGLSLKADGHIQGMPAASEAASFTIKLADAGGAQVRRSFTLRTASGAGDEWRQVGASLITAFDILIDPNNRQHLFAGVSGSFGTSAGSVMESTDGGVSWNDISRNNGLAEYAYNLAINPVDSTLWALAESPSYYDRVAKRWRHWNNCPGTATNRLYDLEFTASGDLYALAYLGECPQNPSLNKFYGFLHSGDGSGAFQSIGALPPARLTPFFGSFAISRSQPNVIYAGRYLGCHRNTCGDENQVEERFYRSLDGGRTWMELPVEIEANLDPRVSSDNPFDVLRFSSNPLYAHAFLERKYIERSVDGGLTWTNLSLPGEPAICRVEQSPSDPDVLLAQTNVGFFRSTDHGLHWTEMFIEGLNITYCSWGAGVTFDPIDANRMFVAAPDHTLFTTTDGGKTWKTLGNGLAIRPMNGIAVSPARPSDLLAVAGFPHVSRTAGDRWTLSAAGVDKGSIFFHEAYGFPLISPRDPNLYYFLNWHNMLFRSDNAGLTWTKLEPNLGRHRFDSLIADPFDAEVLLARISQERENEWWYSPAGIWRSQDRGATWSQVAEVSPALTFFEKQHEWEPEIAFDPRTPGRVYALGPSGLYRSNNRGSSWSLMAQLPGDLSPMVLDVAPSDPRYLYAIRGQTLSAYDAGAGIWRTKVSSGRLISLAVDAVDPRVAYAGRWYTDPGGPPNGSGGIDKTTDAGLTWRRLTGLPTSLSVIGLVAHPTQSGMIFAATKEDGVYRTMDGGATWQKLDNYGAVADLVNVALPDPTNRFILYVGTQGFGVQVSTDGGKTFLPRVTGLGNLNVTSLAFDVGTPMILYAGTEDGLYKTTDGGETWQATAFADGLVTDISVDTGSRPRRVRIVTLTGIGVSQNEGATFTFSSTGLSSLNLTSIEAEPQGTSTRLWVTQRGGDGVAFSDDQGRTWKPAAGNGLRDRNVNDLAIEGRRLWVATDGGVFFSDDTGLSWSPLDIGLPAGVAATSVSIDPNSGEVLVSLFDKEEGGVYRGANFRGSWSAFNEGLSDLRVRKLTRSDSHPLSGTTLGATFYAATSGGGLFTTEIETVSASAPAIGNPHLPDGTLGTAYAAALTATGGVPPYFWSLAAGSLPPGLGLEQAGRIVGTPIQAGLYRFTLKVTDAASKVSRKDLTVQVHDGSTFLRVLKDGNGMGTVTSAPTGILCGADCGEPFPAGTRVNLRAAPASGSIFAGWGGACSGKGACSVTINTAHTVTATFQASGQQLTVIRAGNGAGTVTSKPQGINCGSDCAETFPPKTRVTLSAKPATGSVFAGWSGGGCSGTGSCKVTMTAAREVTAMFNRKKR